MRNEPDPELPGQLPPEVLAPLKQGPLPPDALEEAVIADWRGRQPRFRRRRRARITAPWLFAAAAVIVAFLTGIRVGERRSRAPVEQFVTAPLVPSDLNPEPSRIIWY